MRARNRMCDRIRSGWQHIYNVRSLAWSPVCVLALCLSLSRCLSPALGSHTHTRRPNACRCEPFIHTTAAVAAAVYDIHRTPQHAGYIITSSTSSSHSFVVYGVRVRHRNQASAVLAFLVYKIYTIIQYYFFFFSFSSIQFFAV